MVGLKRGEKEILELYDEGARLKDVAQKPMDIYLATAERLCHAATY